MSESLPHDVIYGRVRASEAQGPAERARLTRRTRSTNCRAKGPAVAGRFCFSVPRCSTPRLGSSAGFDSEGKYAQRHRQSQAKVSAAAWAAG